MSGTKAEGVMEEVSISNLGCNALQASVQKFSKCATFSFLSSFFFSSVFSLPIFFSFHYINAGACTKFWCQDRVGYGCTMIKLQMY